MNIVFIKKKFSEGTNVPEEEDTNEEIIDIGLRISNRNCENRNQMEKGNTSGGDHSGGLSTWIVLSSVTF